jgi:hypothetical protein
MTEPENVLCRRAARPDRPVELTNEVASASLGVGAPCEVVAAEILVVAAVREEVPDDHQN